MQSTVADTFDVTTLLGAEIGLSSLLPVNFQERREFTLNNDLSVFPNDEITVRPKLRYFGLGIKGAYNADDGILQAAYNPARVNMNLFSQIPLRCVPVDEDLSDTERAQYRMRVRRTIKGQEYYLYYLKLIEFTSDIKFKRINPLDGSEEAYELDPSYLHPTPVKANTDITVVSNEDTIVAYCEARIYVTAAEVLEYIRVFYDGDTRYAKISEIGFYTGVEKEVAGVTGNNVAITYNESLYTMLYNHCTWLGTPLTHEGMYIDSVYQITSTGAITDK